MTAATHRRRLRPTRLFALSVILTGFPMAVSGQERTLEIDDLRLEIGVATQLQRQPI
jgi:hypothetical protein